MRTINLCETCRRPLHVELTPDTTSVTCAGCGTERALHPVAWAGGTLQRCAWCD